MNSIQEIKISPRFKLLLNNVVFCEADVNYTKFYLVEGKTVIACKSLKNVEKELSGLSFFRIHKSFLINLNYVTQIDGGNHTIEMSSHHSLSISRRKATRIKKILKTFITN